MSSLDEKLKRLPASPGCYLFKDSCGAMLYIGKAKNLRKRVGTYFARRPKDLKTDRLVHDVADLEIIVVDSELEALLLEAKLISHHQPKYNVDLKGGIRYAYIRITNEPFPRLETVRAFDAGDTVFGPFAVAENRKNLMWLANSLFKLHATKRRPVRVGDQYQIQCSTAPWRRLATEAEYRRDIELAKRLLAGKMPALIKTLEREMHRFSDRRQYELAKLRRDQVAALRSLAERQKVQLKKPYDQDVIGSVTTTNTFFVQLFNINRGVVSGRRKFTFLSQRLDSDPSRWLADFISQYYYHHEIPQEIIIAEPIAQRQLLVRYLSRLSGRKVRITVPQQGDKRKLLALVRKNILADLATEDRVLFELQQALQLPRLPVVIECFDVSNLGSDQIVGSMVHFRNGLPDKHHYRRFKIKWQRRQSDVGAIREIVFRRYYRLKAASAPLPDLVLVDGGRPQLSAARRALRSLGLTLPVAALAKQAEELFIPTRATAVRLPARSAALQLARQIRDEAHRFAITYHRLLRQKKFER